MRSIALTLLLVNLCYLGWILWERSQVVVVQTALDTGPAGNSLVLLEESGVADASPGEPGPQADSRLCTRAGEFPGLEDAYLLIEEARAMGLVAELSLEGSILPAQFRVFLPPYPSRDIAATALDDLLMDEAVKALGVEIYLITRGPLENGIAFGIFADRGSAGAVSEALNVLEYPAEVGEVPRAEGAIFVLLRDGQTGPVSAQIWAQLVLDRPYLSRSENVC